MKTEEINQLWYDHSGVERNGEMLNLMTEDNFKAILSQHPAPMNPISEDEIGKKANEFSDKFIHDEKAAADYAFIKGVRWALSRLNKPYPHAMHTPNLEALDKAEELYEYNSPEWHAYMKGAKDSSFNKPQDSAQERYEMAIKYINTVESKLYDPADVRLIAIYASGYEPPQAEPNQREDD